MTITAVGSIFQNTGSPISSVAVSPTAVGDILVLTSAGTAIGNIGTPSGGGVTTWNKLAEYAPGVLSIWWGVVTATGASTISFTSAAACAVSVQQFHSSVVAVGWSQDGTGAGVGTNGTSGNYPGLTPAGANELYVAVGTFFSNPMGGATAGFTYLNPIGSSGQEVVGSLVYNLAASSPTLQQPAWTQPSSTTCYLAAGLLQYIPFSAPSAPTLLTPANASYIDVAPGLLLSAVYNSTDTCGQNKFALRLKISGGAYGYWNGTDFSSSTVVWNSITTAPGATFSVTIPAGVLANGHVYNWSFASQESGANSQGVFATDFVFTSQVAPTVTPTAPTGTVTLSEPTVTWTETLASSTSQINYRVVIESGSFGTVPGVGTSAWDSGVITSAALSVVVGSALPNGIAYRAFVQIAETGGELSAWSHIDFTVAANLPATPAITAVVVNDITSGLPEVLLSVTAFDNLLTANQSNLELGVTTGWAAGANTTIAASTTWAQTGLTSLRMTATGAGAVSATTPTGTGGMVCLPGQTVRAMAWLHSPTTPRACTVAIGFYNAAGSLISTSTSASVNSTTTGGATGAQAFITATVPALTAFAALIVNGAALGAGEFLYADQLLFAPGTSTAWSVGGFIGASTITILRSDGAYVRNAGWPVSTSLIVPAGTQATSAVDVEASPGVAMTYSAVVVAGTVSSVAAVSSPVTLSLPNWDIMDPLNPSAGTAIQWAGDSRTFDQTEIQGVFNTLGRASSVVVRGDLHSQSFDLSLNFGGDNDAAWQAFDALRSGQVTVMLRGDMAGDLYYMALGSARPLVTYRTGDRVNNPSRSLVIRCNPVDRP